MRQTGAEGRPRIAVAGQSTAHECPVGAKSIRADSPAGSLKAAPGPETTPPRTFLGIRASCESTRAVVAWELRSFFLRPAAWVMLLTATLTGGWSFAWLVTLLSRGSGPALRTADDPIVQFLGPNLFLVGLCTLFVPVLTMNAVADERRRGAWELLLTSPITLGQALTGKWIALWCTVVAMLAPWPLFLGVLRVWNGRTKWLWGFVPWFDGAGVPFDLGAAAGGIVGLIVVAATCVSLGLFCSSLCRRPLAAALLAFVCMTALVGIEVLPRVLEIWGFEHDQVSWIGSFSCWGQLERMCRGTLRPRELVGHLSFCLALLYLTACAARQVDEA